MKKFIYIFFILVVVVCITKSSQAATLDFEGLATNTGGGLSVPAPYSEDGYLISTAPGTNLNSFGSGWQSGRGSTNGTTTLGVANYSSLTSMITISRADAQLFNMLSIDLAELLKNGDFAEGARADRIVFNGLYGAGGSITETFVFDNINDGGGSGTDFQTHTFNGAWSALDSISLTAINDTSWFSGSYEIMSVNYDLDNIEVEQYDSAPVPEPATIALLGIGIAGLAGAEVRRRRKKRSVDNG